MAKKKSTDPLLNAEGEHVYLAGPFFNARQVAVVDALRRTVEETCGLSVYSPKDDGGILTPNATAEQRAKVVTENRDAILRSLFVLAVLDYPMDPEDHALVVVRPTRMRSSAIPAPGKAPYLLGEMRSPPLTLTDNGTAWECGFATAAQITVVGYVHDVRVKRLNVMLTDTTAGVLVGERRLRAWLQEFAGLDADPAFNWGGLTAWTGHTQ